MTKYFYLSATLFIAASQQCHAMRRPPCPVEIIPNPALITTLTIKNPQSALWIDNNNVAIVSNDGCSIYDTSTNEKVKKLTDGFPGSTSITLHPNKKLLAITYNGYLQIYNTLTNEKIYENNLKQWCDLPAFNSMDDTIVIGKFNNDFDNGIHSFNYKNNSHKLYSLQDRTNVYTKIEFHPTKQECTLSIGNRPARILSLNNDPLITREVVTSEYHFRGINKYSPDGSLIAVGSTEGCYIFNPESGVHNLLIGTQNKSVYAMVFHPTSSILAILPNDGQRICYWNAKTQKLIATTSLITTNNTKNDYIPDSTFNQRIDFSCDATKVIVALENECLVLEVPFELLSNELYERNTKNKAIFALLVLQQYLHDDSCLPQDIVHFLIENLLQLAQPSKQHCCETMYYDLLNDTIKYVPHYREYHDNREEDIKNFVDHYCGNCGTKLPYSLRDTWFATLKQEYGLEDPLDTDKQDIPKEFLTDEWWKKRGL